MLSTLINRFIDVNSAAVLRYNILIENNDINFTYPTFLHEILLKNTFFL